MRQAVISCCWRVVTTGDELLEQRRLVHTRRVQVDAHALVERVGVQLLDEATMGRVYAYDVGRRCARELEERGAVRARQHGHVHARVGERKEERVERLARLEQPLERASEEDHLLSTQCKRVRPWSSRRKVSENVSLSLIFLNNKKTMIEL